jgi:hypothetical protein
MLSESTAVAQIEWAKETQKNQLLVWDRGGDGVSDSWLVLPIVKSVGGGAGIFAAPPQIDPGSSSIIMQGMTTNANEVASRKKTDYVVLEISVEDWGAMYSYMGLLQTASDEQKRAVSQFRDGLVPRVSVLLESLRAGPLAEFVASLPAEDPEEAYVTADDRPSGAPPGLAAGRSAADMVANAQAAARQQASLSGPSR